MTITYLGGIYVGLANFGGKYYYANGRTRTEVMYKLFDLNSHEKAYN